MLFGVLISLPDQRCQPRLPEVEPLQETIAVIRELIPMDLQTPVWLCPARLRERAEKECEISQCRWVFQSPSGIFENSDPLIDARGDFNVAIERRRKRNRQRPVDFSDRAR